ncbi:hypothetical protein [Exiguobacterium aurantiacum]|uniref:hypothetical protein n=1 Tax=Exiguobacterium aurantiacum TaxID=33987 RepID=UPI00384E79DE
MNIRKPNDIGLSTYKVAPNVMGATFFSAKVIIFRIRRKFDKNRRQHLPVLIKISFKTVTDLFQ